MSICSCEFVNGRGGLQGTFARRSDRTSVILDGGTCNKMAFREMESHLERSAP